MMGSATAPRSAGPLPPLSLNAWLRYDLVGRMLPPGGGDLLDVGCGQAAIGARLAARYRYVGLEPDPASYAIAAARLAAAGNGGEVRNGDLSALAPGETFDVVCAFEVLEHLEDDAGALADWVARARPGGSVLISTPAHQSRYGVQDELVGHFRRYDPPALAALMRESGLDDVGVRLYGMPAGYALEAARNYLGRRRIAAVASVSMAERTRGSGRLRQPDGPAAAWATRVATAPFRLAQRAFPHTGPTLVARGRVRDPGAAER